jgi:uncharacterized protein (UPF0218 family)
LFSVPTYLLTDELRHDLKQPLGELVKGSPAECNRVLKAAIVREKPLSVILIGDGVSRFALQGQIQPDVIVVDKKEKRENAIQFQHGFKRILETKNKAGMIEQQAWRTIEEALAKQDCAVMVDGEEDLLTIPAILAAPLRSLVVYGQPNVGIVLVRVTEEKKKEIRAILDRMEKGT